MTQPPDPSRWKQIKAVAGEALELPHAERDQYLDRACADDASLRAEVRTLIGDYETAQNDFDPPVVADADEMFAQGDFGEQSLIGAAIGQYTVLRLIGRGGMGAVFEAIQNSPRRRVALKVMRGGLASRAAVKRFRQESEVLARLLHPNIAQVYEAGVHTDENLVGRSLPFFAMEYIEDPRPITTAARELNLSTGEKIDLLLPACDAVHHAHQRGVIHRDLKPANILVSAAARPPLPKVIDFGVARATRADMDTFTVQTLAGQIVGTLAYMAPEQCRAGNAEADVRSDVYSLGVVLYELLCGRLPYVLPDSGVLDTVRTIVESTPARPSLSVPTLKGDAETILLKALAKGVADRYQSVAEFADDLRRYRRSEPISARAPGAIHQLRLFARRNRALVAGVVGVFAALVLGVIGTSVGMYNARVARAEALRHADRSERTATFLKNTLRSAGRDYAYLPAGPPEERELLRAWELGDTGWGPAGDPQSNASMREILMAAEKHVATDFADSPETQAELSLLIADLMDDLGAVDTSVHTLQRAVEILHRTRGPDDSRTILARLKLARATLGDRPADALATMNAAHQSAARVFGPFDARTRALRRGVMGALAYQDPAASIQQQRAFIAACEEHFGAAAPQTLIEIQYLANQLAGAGQLQDAQALARRAYDGLRGALGEDDDAALEAGGNLRYMLRALPDRLAGAEPLHRDLLRLAEKKCGPDHHRTADARRDLASLLLRLRRPAEAVPFARANLELTQRIYSGDAHPLYKDKGFLARCLVATGQPSPEAEVLAREAAETNLRLGGDGGTLNFSRASRIGAIRLNGRPKEAADLARSFKDADPGFSAVHSVDRSAIHLQHARALIDLQDYPQAERILREADAGIASDRDLAHPLRWEISDGWAALREKIDKQSSRPAGLPGTN